MPFEALPDAAELRRWLQRTPNAGDDRSRAFARYCHQNNVHFDTMLEAGLHWHAFAKFVQADRPSTSRASFTPELDRMIVSAKEATERARTLRIWRETVHKSQSDAHDAVTAVTRSGPPRTADDVRALSAQFEKAAESSMLVTNRCDELTKEMQRLSEAVRALDVQPAAADENTTELETEIAHLLADTAKRPAAETRKRARSPSQSPNARLNEPDAADIANEAAGAKIDAISLVSAGRVSYDWRVLADKPHHVPARMVGFENGETVTWAIEYEGDLVTPASFDARFTKANNWQKLKFVGETNGGDDHEDKMRSLCWMFKNRLPDYTHVGMAKSRLVQVAGAASA